jgi:transcriptional regulator with XRE-family HTH domain
MGTVLDKFKKEGNRMNMPDEFSKLIKEIGRKLRKARNLRGITLEELADRAGRDWSYICQLESGKGNPSIKTLYLICKQLQIPLSSLFSKGTVEPVYKPDPFANRISYYLKEATTKDKKTVADVVKKMLHK